MKLTALFASCFVILSILPVSTPIRQIICDSTKSFVNNETELEEIIPQDHYYNDCDQDQSTYTTQSNLTNTNIVHRDYNRNVTCYENFNVGSYENRETTSYSLSKSSQWSVIGSDNRIQVDDPKSLFYPTTGYMRMTFYNVYNQKEKTYDTLFFRGTAFLVGPNVAVSAGHCCFDDVTNSGDYQDNTYNPRFPNKVEFYFGCESSDDISQGENYTYYSKATDLFVEWAWTTSMNKNVDWAVIKMDRDIGEEAGNYTLKITDPSPVDGGYNSIPNNNHVYTWGYPGDKPRGTMWRSSGTVLSQNDYKLYYDMDTYGGQSGSPVFYEEDNSFMTVRAIHTGSYNEGNGATKIKQLIVSLAESCYSSPYTKELVFEELKFNMIGKEGSYWNIEIKNESSHVRTVEYNTKMCFESDAKNWSGLNNIESITLEPYESTIVSIKTNFAATSIAASFVDHGKRVITYANKLSTSGLTSYTNII